MIKNKCHKIINLNDKEYCIQLVNINNDDLLKRYIIKEMNGTYPPLKTVYEILSLLSEDGKLNE